MHVQLLRSTIPPILGSRATRRNVAQPTAIRSEDRWKGVCCQRLGLGNNNNVKINSYNIYTQRSRSTTDSHIYIYIYIIIVDCYYIYMWIIYTKYDICIIYIYIRMQLHCKAPTCHVELNRRHFVFVPQLRRNSQANPKRCLVRSKPESEVSFRFGMCKTLPRYLS